MRYLGGYLAVLTLTVALACSGDGGQSPSGGCKDNGGGAAGQVTVGNIFFRSARNGSCDPAVDTVISGTMVTWTWTGTGGTSHSIESEGSPSFTSSAIMAGNGSTYSFQFNTPGTYQYDCAVHGSAMTGRIVVQ
jgi:plastocyanin